MESLTLWLDGTQPLKWVKKLETSKWQRNLVVIGVAEFVLVATVAISFQYGSLSLKQTGIQILAFLMSLLALPAIMKKYGPKTTSWLVQDTKPLGFIKRFFLLLLLGYFCFGIYQFGILGSLITILDLGDIFDESSRAHI